MEVAAEAVAETAEEAGETPLQEGHPQETQPVEEAITDSSDNLQTYSPEIEPRQRSFSRNGSSITI